jgi:glutamate racemase
MTELLHSYLTMIDADIDYLVLGCSHYPYLIPQIKEILPNHIQIIDSGEAVANKPRVFTRKVGTTTEKIVDLLSIPMQIQKY